jgi:YD repeat-containing protein
MFPHAARWSIHRQWSFLRRRFTFRSVVALTVFGSFLPFAVGWSTTKAAPGQSVVQRAGRPRPGKPDGNWPNLEEVQRESEGTASGQTGREREAAPPIPSTLRSPKVPLQPWNGRRVGDQIVRAHARRLTPPPVLDDQFIQNFFMWAVSRAPSGDEPGFWNDQFRVAYAQGQPSLNLIAVALGKTLFESAEYAARGRDDHWYVYDLYKTFLMREPDASGWTYWQSQVPLNGRVNVRRAFEEAPEFAAILASIVPNGTATANAASLVTARVERRNQPGGGMLARDANWSVSLLSLPGRNGLDLGLGLSYSSMVWTRSGPYLHFDEDNGFPSPGFRLGFPSVQRRVFNAQTARNAYLLITSSGQRVELRQVGTSNVYDAADSSYLQLTDNSPNLLLRATDGTQLSFVEIDNEYRCTQVKDRNGNYLTINHNALGQIATVADTLSRVINFNYDAYANLLSLTQSWNGQPAHQWVSFGWGTRNVQPAFTSGAVVGTAAGALLPVITQVTLNDTSHFTFEYTNSLQVSAIKNYFGTLERNATGFTYETPAGDVPRLIDSRMSARNWSGVNGLPAQIITTYNVAGDGACVLTTPDGTVYKEYYGAGWQKGLPVLSEVWSGGVRQKWTTTVWTQDNPAVGYEVNPRVIETNVYDASGNRRRTVIDYGGYAQYGLPYWVKEYGADGVTEIRHTFTDYNLSQAYLDRRIILYRKYTLRTSAVIRARSATLMTIRHDCKLSRPPRRSTTAPTTLRSPPAGM